MALQPVIGQAVMLWEEKSELLESGIHQRNHRAKDRMSDQAAHERHESAAVARHPYSRGLHRALLERATPLSRWHARPRWIK